MKSHYIILLACILFGLQSPIAAQSSDWVYSPYTQYLTNDTTIPPPVGEPADAALSCFRHDTIYALITPSGLLYIWLRPDPLMDKYINLSPYAYCSGNPLKYIDPEGESTWVASNDDGTYTVIGGDINDGSLQIYEYKQDENGEYTIRGQSIGYSLSPFSFYNCDNGEWSVGSKINPYDNSGKKFLSIFFLQQESLTDYVLDKGRTGQLYDFKKTNAAYPIPNGSFKDPYRGMPIFGGVYASARDIGNFAAGYIAGSYKLPYWLTRIAFDAYQNHDAIKNKQYGQLTPESLSSQIPQMVGWYVGRIQGQFLNNYYRIPANAMGLYNYLNNNK